MNEEEKKDNLKEPLAEYKSKRMQFFSSFEDEAEANIREQLKLTPEQRLANATALIKKIYSEELKQNRGLGTKIYFDGQ